MRVLHCIPSVEGGGAERQLTYLAGALPSYGCEVHVALTRDGANLSRLEQSGATLHRLGPRGTHDPRLFTRLMHTIAIVKPAIVHCWLLQMELLGGLAATASGVPWLLAERSSGEAYPPTMKNYLRVRMAAFASGIVSNSAGGDAYWSERARKSVRRYIVPNAIPIDEIAAAPVAPPDVGGFASRAGGVLYAGRLDAGKNAESLVRALALLPPDRSVRAVLCGEGPLREHIHQLVDTFKLTDRVDLPGYAPNLWSLMKGANLLVSPSRFEGSPNVVLEAMACGCPLVLSDIPAHREIADEESALFFEPNDVGALADRIADVLGHPASAADRARAAHARADRYDLSQIAERYAAVYRDVLSPPARRFIRVAS